MAKTTKKLKAKQARLRQPTSDPRELIRDYPSFKGLRKNEISGLSHGYVNFLRSSSRAIKQETRKNFYAREAARINKLITNPEVARNRDVVLEKAWRDFVDGYNREFDNILKILLDDLDSISKKITKKEFKRLAKEIKSAFQRSLTNARKQEFFAYVIAGRIEEFNPHDWISGLIAGDIDIAREDGSSIKIQLKQLGGDFKIGYNLGAFNSQASKMVNDSRRGEIESKLAALDSIRTYLDKLDWKTIAIENDTPAFKKGVIEKYVKTTAAEYFVILFTGLIDGPGFSIALNKDQLVEFVAKYPDLFSLIFNPKNRQVLLKLVKNPNPATFWQMPFVLGATIHGYTEHRFYSKKGTTRRRGTSPGSHTISQSIKYREEIVETMDDFLIIHESIFGPLEYV